MNVFDEKEIDSFHVLRAINAGQPIMTQKLGSVSQILATEGVYLSVLHVVT